MKNINKKAIAVSLALIMITSMFTACKKTNAVTEDGTSKENLQGSVSTESNAETSDRTESAGETEMSSEKSFSDAEESGEIKSETEGTTKKALGTKETTTKKPVSTTKVQTTKAPATDNSEKKVPYTITKIVNGKATQFTIIKTYTSDGEKYEVASDGSLFIDGKYVNGVNMNQKYLSYEEVKECVAQAEAYAISKGFKIDRELTIYNSSYGPGADTFMIGNDKAFYLQYIKDDIDWWYSNVVEDLGYFSDKAALNIYIAGPEDLANTGLVTHQIDGTPRYIAYVCA